jgi:hypothetical protein
MYVMKGRINILILYVEALMWIIPTVLLNNLNDNYCNKVHVFSQHILENDDKFVIVIVAHTIVCEFLVLCPKKGRICLYGFDV